MVNRGWLAALPTSMPCVCSLGAVTQPSCALTPPRGSRLRLRVGGGVMSADADAFDDDRDR
jgi:hypothetical protein